MSSPEQNSDKGETVSDSQPPPTKMARYLNLFSAIMNLINSIIGAGIVALPSAIKNTGLIFGVTFSLFSCFLIAYTADLMIKATSHIEKHIMTKDGETGRLPINSYAELCKQTLGMWSFYLLCIINFLLSFLCLCVYNILFRNEISSTISDIMNTEFLYDKYLLLGVAIVCILPMCLLRDISKLGYVSFVSIIAVFIIVIIVSVRSPVYGRYLKANNLTVQWVNERKLNMERTVYFCTIQETGKTAFLRESITNPKVLLNALNTHDVCSNPSYSRFEEALESIKDNIPDFVDNGPAATNNVPALWVNVTSFEHARYLNTLYYIDPNHVDEFDIVKFLGALGIYSSAFIDQQTIFSIFRALLRQNLREWRFVQGFAFPPTYLLCMLLGVMGYSTQKYQAGSTVFTKMKLRYYVQGSQIDIPTNTARILLVGTIGLTFPMQNFFARKNLLLILVPIYNRVFGTQHDSDYAPNVIFYVSSVIMFGLALIFGLYIDALEKVYSLMGSMFASPLIYIIPTLLWLSVEQNIKAFVVKAYQSGKKKDFLIKVVIPILICIYGVVLTMMSSVTSFINIFKGA